MSVISEDDYDSCTRTMEKHGYFDKHDYCACVCASVIRRNISLISII